MRLIEHLSNRTYLKIVDQLLNVNSSTLSALATPQRCRCGCGQAVATGHRFVNQAHYDQSKGPSVSDADQLLARFQQGVPIKQLAREYRVAHTTVYRLLRKNGLR